MQPTVLYLERVDSTNRYLKDRAGKLPHGCVCYTLDQYAGAGRRGRQWAGQKGEMLAVSVLLHHALIQDMPVLPLLCALAATRVLDQQTGRDFQIKWPNDVVLQGKKICGILCESRVGAGPGADGFAVCGTGFNLTTKPEQFQQAGLPYAASVKMLTGICLDPQQVAREYWQSFLQLVQDYREAGSFSPFSQEYRRRCVTLGKPVRVLFEGREVEGQCVDVSPQGELLVQIGGTLHVICSGEASVRGLYGYV